MEIFVKIAQLILSLSILIILHEFGHFAFAKLFKTKVEKFYLFFDPWFSLFKVKKGETEYGIGWLPLGGYVKISGMIDESMDKEALKKPPQPYEFRAKPAWQRLLIMVGGVLVNFLLALVIYTGITYAWGEKYLPVDNMTKGIMVDSLGYEIGFRNGDMIESVAGEKIEKFSDIHSTIILNEVEEVTVRREGNLKTIHIAPHYMADLLANPVFINPGIPFEINKIQNDTVPAAKAGLKPGDKIVGINGESMYYFFDLRQAIRKYTGKNVELMVQRNSDTLVKNLQIGNKGTIGVVVNYNLEDYFQLKKIEYGLLEAIPVGINRGVNAMGSYIKQFKLILNPETKAYESVGSFIRIGSFFPGTWDWQVFWGLTAFLSVALAFLNILPIPALDGGHVIFLLAEVISGRKPSEKFMEYAQIVGMVLLLSLMLLAFYNDINHFFFK
jgi:regulator of sigma E protease